ncbi:MAG: hypothetical protein QM689_00550 [Oscillospiraceae bacterium]
MSKICKSCGAEYTGAYCEQCGFGKPAQKSRAVEKIEKQLTKTGRHEDRLSAQYHGQKLPPDAAKIAVQKRTRNIVLCVLLAAVAAVVLLVLYKNGAFGKNSREDVIRNYFVSIAENDYDKYLKTMPKAVRKSYDDMLKEQKLTKSSYLKESYSDYYDYFGDSFTASVEFGDADNITNEGSTVADSERMYKENYGKTISISEAYETRAIVTFTGSKNTAVLKYDVLTAKINGKWYIMDIQEAEDPKADSSAAS